MSAETQKRKALEELILANAKEKYDQKMRGVWGMFPGQKRAEVESRAYEDYRSAIRNTSQATTRKYR